jgi:hypothetical protein
MTTFKKLPTAAPTIKTKAPISQSSGESKATLPGLMTRLPMNRQMRGDPAYQYPASSQSTHGAAR